MKLKEILLIIVEGFVRCIHLSFVFSQSFWRWGAHQHRIQDGQRGGGTRNMKYKGPPMAAIFFMTSFHRDRGAWPPWLPHGSAAAHSRGCTILWLGGVRRHDGAFPFSHLQDSGGRWCYGPLFFARNSRAVHNGSFRATKAVLTSGWK